jgi:hypothetical protein
MRKAFSLTDPAKEKPRTPDARGYIDIAMDMSGADRLGSIAIAYAASGNHDKAVEYLQKGYSEGDDILMWTRYPVFDIIRSDARYVQMMRKIGVPE